MIFLLLKLGVSHPKMTTYILHIINSNTSEQFGANWLNKKPWIYMSFLFRYDPLTRLTIIVLADNLL